MVKTSESKKIKSAKQREDAEGLRKIELLHHSLHLCHIVLNLRKQDIHLARLRNSIHHIRCGSFFVGQLSSKLSENKKIGSLKLFTVDEINKQNSNDLEIIQSLFYDTNLGGVNTLEKIRLLGGIETDTMKILK